MTLALLSSALKTPIIKNDALVFGLLMLVLAGVFYTSSIKKGFWGLFYKYVPALLLCYFIPGIFNSIGLINGDDSQVYYIASRYLLPAALILMTLSIDLKAISNLGPKALIMFFTGTIGIVLGGPIAVLLVGWLAPDVLAGTGLDAVWRGLATIAGSWIGGGANQTAMLEIFEYNPSKFGAMVLVDIAVANIWMAILLLGIGKSKRIDQWLKADARAIEILKERVITFVEKIKRDPSLTDYMILLGVAFAGVGLAHWGSQSITSVLGTIEIFTDKSSALSSFTYSFFWLITIATIIGVSLSFTKFKKFEGAGASKLGSIFIYILVASIGTHIDIVEAFKNPGLLVIGLIWIAIHAGLLIGVAKLIKAPYFFLAVGSQANVGGAASAPVVAAEFHPSLASVGVLLAVFGYVVGTYGAIACAWLMQIASGG